MDPERVDALLAVRDLLIQQAGGFLRNVVWELGVTCVTCAGIPSAGYAQCRACSSFPATGYVADRVGFVTYGYWPHQSGSVMHGYKDPSPYEGSVRVVTLMLAYALNRHQACLSGSAGAPTHWAVVPSLKHPGVDHRLAQITRPLMPRMPEIPLLAAAAPVNPRGFTPSNYLVPDYASVQGSHVLLLDDTWTTGGHVQSASAALKQAGADRVTALVLARWLDPAWAGTKAFIDHRLARDFDPDLCPFTGLAC